MPKYSVLLTVYNSEKYLDECFNSILCQTFNDFEVVVVDDASTDSSGKICDKYARKDSRVKVIHKANEGVNVARKTAFENSTGDYILTVDCDDIIDHDLIETVDGIFEKYSCDIVMFDLSIFDNKTGKVTIKKMAEKSCFYDKKNKHEFTLYKMLPQRNLRQVV